MINRTETPIIFEFRLKNLAQEIINAIYKRAWISHDKAQNLRELIQTDDTKRAITEIAIILTNLSTDIRKIERTNNHGV